GPRLDVSGSRLLPVREFRWLALHALLECGLRGIGEDIQTLRQQAIGDCERYKGAQALGM
ncbi:MAG: hypothetical protein AAFY83_13705, partial [Pseudomonadota bacterium]